MAVDNIPSSDGIAAGIAGGCDVNLDKEKNLRGLYFFFYVFLCSLNRRLKYVAC